MNPSNTWHRLLALPEFNVALLAFLLNFVWEMMQVPFYVSMPEMPHWEGVLFCARATLGDVAIAVVSYWVVAALAGSGRAWILSPVRRDVAGFVVTGVAITAVLEVVFTRVWHRWSYSEMMPVVPALEVGLVPVLQWIVLPPLIVWLVRRQLT